MNELGNWKEVTRGIYQYPASNGMWYEIIVAFHRHYTELLSAHAQLFLVGDIKYAEEGSYFEREYLLAGPLSGCIQAAIEHKKNYKF